MLEKIDIGELFEEMLFSNAGKGEVSNIIR